MVQQVPDDAASFARQHAGELDASLTATQRELLGRVIARRIERGAKLDAIARAAATALFDLEPQRARRLGRDETLRAFAWESRQSLLATGANAIALSPAGDACPACRAAAGVYSVAALPSIPVAGCTHHGGCRCRYQPPSEGLIPTTAAAEYEPTSGVATPLEQPAERVRRWYRPHPPRPHGPRWTEEDRAARAGHRRADRPSPPEPSRPALPPRTPPLAPAPPPPRTPAPARTSPAARRPRSAGRPPRTRTPD